MSAARATSTADSFRTPRACLSTLPNDGAIATPVRGKRTVVNVVTTVDNPPERGSLQRQTCREAPFPASPDGIFASSVEMDHARSRWFVVGSMVATSVASILVGIIALVSLSGHRRGYILDRQIVR